jgi:hypothetical protein
VTSATRPLWSGISAAVHFMAIRTKSIAPPRDPMGHIHIDFDVVARGVAGNCTRGPGARTADDIFRGAGLRTICTITCDITCDISEIDMCASVRESPDRARTGATE